MTPSDFKPVLTRTCHGFVDVLHGVSCCMYLDRSAIGPEIVEGNRRLVRIY